MTVKKGLTTLVNNTPDFSNQHIENAVNDLKIGWVTKSIELDTAIQDNTVLTTSQKNDLKADINNVTHLNLGRTLGDLIRHSASIIDGSILPVDQDVDNPTPGTLLEILQSVLSLQGLVPQLYGVTASAKSRAVNDHLGTLNNIFTTTDDSSAPVFTSLLESINFIVTADLATETALETAYDNLKNFINGVVADSTDFQQTLDGFATAVATAHTNLNNALASEPLLTHKNNLIAQREKINVQVSLENSNLVGIRSYVESLINTLSYVGLAADDDMRKVIIKIAQNKEWQTYFNDYEKNSANLNPIYTTGVDSDKASIIDSVLRDSGLPDVLDFVDLEAVANKASKDARIDTAGYDRLTVEQQISDACKQLNITTTNRSVYNQSESLLDNLNLRDRAIIAEQLDLNQDADTLS